MRSAHGMSDRSTGLKWTKVPATSLLAVSESDEMGFSPDLVSQVRTNLNQVRSLT